LAVLWKPGCGVIIAGGKCERGPVDDIARGRLEYMDWWGTLGKLEDVEGPPGNCSWGYGNGWLWAVWGAIAPCIESNACMR
jgi:hypothetical protein